jgi:putative DNA primase/helicase
MDKKWLMPDFNSIMPELKRVDNWVLTRPIERGGKITKPPFQPNGKPASHSDPDTWSSFDAVRQAFGTNGFVSVGFVLDAKPHFDRLFLHGFDWDDCVIDGRLDAEVASKVKELNMHRLELSVSGTGIRGFFFHHQPLESRRTQINGRSVELYSNKRYMTTTGIEYGEQRWE